MTGNRIRAWRDFAVFLVILGALVFLHGCGSEIDHVLGTVLKVLLYGVGSFLFLYRLVWKREGTAAAGQLAILPRRWQKWVLGEADKPSTGPDSQ